MDLTADQSLVLTPCVQDRNGIDRVPVVVTNPISPKEVRACINWVRGSLEKDAATAGSKLPTPLSADELLTMQASMEETYVDQDDGKSYYKNLRCNNRASSLGSRCEYILRAKRVNVLPDGPELVFLDTNREVVNPVFPIWLILSGTGTVGTPPFSDRICTTKPRPMDVNTPYYNRAFSTVRRGKAVYQHQTSICL